MSSGRKPAVCDHSTYQGRSGRSRESPGSGPRTRRATYRVRMTILGAMLVMAVLLVGLVLLVLRMTSTRRVTVSEQIRLPRSLEGSDQAVISVLRSMHDAQALTVAPAQHALVLRRIPVWVVIPVLLLFPLGLLFLLVREDVRLDVSVTEDVDGSVVWLSGRTEKYVLEELRTSLLRLPAG
jgi:hypothetical protein